VSGARPGGGLRREQAVDLGFRNAVVTAGGRGRTNATVVNPLLQRRVAHAEAICCSANGEEFHGAATSLHE
jgi:hypothetical protein